MFLLFAFLSGVALLYFARRVPETKQRSLHDIELDLGRPAPATAAPAAGPFQGGDAAAAAQSS